MKLQPIIYTKDTAAAVAWYGKVLDKEPLYRSDMQQVLHVERQYHPCDRTA